MPHSQYSQRYLVLLVGLLMLVSIINVADKELLAPIAGAVQSELGMSDTQLGAVRSGVFIAALLGQLFWGPLSDRGVRKHIIATGTLIWSGITWMTAFVTSYPQLMLARAGMSFAEGCFNPSAYALVTDSVERRRHGLVLGLMSLTYPVGTASALVVASLVGTSHWRQPFHYYGLLGLSLGVLVLLLVREPRRGASEEAIQAGEGVYAGRFSLREFRHVLSVPTVWLGFALDTCQATVNWTIAFWAPIYLVRYKIAPDAETAAKALLPAILGFVLGAVLGGVVIDRLRRRTVRAAAWVGLISMAGGFVAALAVFNIFRLGWLMAAAFILGVVSYMVMPAVNIVLFSVVPPETKATTISASNVILNLVIAVVSLAIGVVSDAAELRLAFGGAVLVMFFLGVLVCLTLLRTFERDVHQREAVVQGRVVGEAGQAPH